MFELAFPQNHKEPQYLSNNRVYSERIEYYYFYYYSERLLNPSVPLLGRAKLSMSTLYLFTETMAG